MNRAVKLRGHAERLRAVWRAKNVVAILLEDITDQFAHDLLVFDDENRFVILRFFDGRGRRFGTVDWCSLEREINAERAPFTGLTVDADAATRLADDAVDRCEAKTGPFPRTLRSEERLEDA